MISSLFCWLVGVTIHSAIIPADHFSQTVLGFRPNALARGLRERHTRTVGVIIHDITDPYFAEIARGVADTALEEGFLTIICNTDRNAEEELRYVGMLAESGVAGVLFVGGGLRDPEYRRELGRIVKEIHAYGGQVVALGPRYDRWPPQFWTIEEAPRQRWSIFFRLVTETSHSSLDPPFYERLRNVTQVSTMLSTRQASSQTLNSASSEISPARGVHRRWRPYFNGSAPLTAVFCSSDTMAIGCLHTLRHHGVRVPEELSLVGFDNILVAEFLSPPLTTVDLHMRDIGINGMRRLHDLLRETDRRKTIRTHETMLIVRQSSAPPRGVYAGFAAV